MTTAAVRDRQMYTNMSARDRSAGAPAQRVTSIDIVRGVVMLLMAIDHVRVYSGQPAGGPTPGIFFTRWITHFVAPAFVFLAGTSAYLYGERAGNTRALSRFLVTRGLWLVFLELTVLRVAWTFNFDFAHYMLAGVIWMIGWCMVLMAGIVFLPRVAIAVGAVAMIVLHNLVFPALAVGPASLWTFLYFGGAVGKIAVLFVIIPWVGVMAAGYAFGPVMRLEPERRRAVCMRLGLGAIVAFVALRGLDKYGDPRPWNTPSAQARARGAPGTQTQTPPPQAGPPRPRMPALLRFLNTAKYPASLDFLLMTLGPMLVLLALVDAAGGPVARVLETFGRVPFFYYLLHIPTIHLAACIVSLVREGSVNPWLFTNHPMWPPEAPAGYIWSLPLLYLVWAIVVTALYVPCRWFARVRAEKRSRVLSYL